MTPATQEFPTPTTPGRVALDKQEGAALMRTALSLERGLVHCRHDAQNGAHDPVNACRSRPKIGATMLFRNGGKAEKSLWNRAPKSKTKGRRT